MKIYTPVKDFDGTRASVRFIRGVGETNDPNLIKWFENRGYRIEKSVETSVETHDEQPDFDAMTPNELREWMKANGMGNQIKNIRNKEKLLEIIRG